MHFKLGLLSGLAAVASAYSNQNVTPYGDSNDYEIQNHGTSSSSKYDYNYVPFNKHYVTQYVHPNVEETCFSVRPVASCNNDYVATLIRHQKVAFHCLDSNLPITKQYKKQVRNGEKLHWEGKSHDIQAYVDVPIRCEKIDSQIKNLRKINENNNLEQRIHLIQPQDNFESFSEDLELYNNQIQIDSSENKFRNEVDWTYTEKIDSKHLSVKDVLEMNPDEFENLMETLKFAAHQINNKYLNYGVENHFNQQINHALPNFFSKISKQFYETVVYDSNDSHAQNEQFYEQYKELVRRVYAYVVKQVLKNKNYNTYASQYQYEHQFTMIVRNLWYKIQRELTPEEVNKVNEIVNSFENKKHTIDIISMGTSWSLNHSNQWKKVDQQLTKVWVSGLFIANKQYNQENQTPYTNLMARLNKKLHNFNTWNSMN